MFSIALEKVQLIKKKNAYSYIPLCVQLKSLFAKLAELTVIDF